MRLRAHFLHVVKMKLMKLKSRSPLVFCMALHEITDETVPSLDLWASIRANLKLALLDDSELKRRQQLPDPDPDGPPY